MSDLVSWRKSYYQKNRESILEKQKKYALENLDKIRNYQKEYRRRDYVIKQRVESRKRYRSLEQYKESIRKARLRWTKTPKGIFRTLRINAIFRKMPFKLTMPDFLNWYDKQIKECVYCGVSEKDIQSSSITLGRSIIHKRLNIDRKDSALGYELSNIVLACQLCNTVKTNILTFDEMKILGQTVIKKRWC